MARKYQSIASDMKKCCIETATKSHEIRSTVVNVSKLLCGTKVIGPDFYLTSDCMCCVSFKKDGGFLYVYIRNKSAVEIKITRTIVLYDSNYTKLYEQSSEDILSLEKVDKDVIGCASSSILDTLTNDILIIDLCVNVKEIETKRITRFICATNPERKLREDFKAMLENPVNSDVSLQVGDEKIPAHWLILCSRSPYFKRMFDSGMKERVQNCIAITDSSIDTVKKLIQFLYTADFMEGDDLQELFDLYYVADKCEVMDLRTLCASKILSKATTDNVSRILQLAHRHNDKGLKMETMDFIRLHSDAVFQTEDWKKFETSEQLAAEIFGFFCLKKN